MTAWRECDREDDVRRASAAGRWTPALEGHVSVCDRCHEVQVVTRALAAPVAPGSMPDPAVLWLRARATARLRSIARVDRVLTVAQITFGVIAVVTMAAGAEVLGLKDAPAIDVNSIVVTGGVILTAATALVLRRARP
jgi:hypothetical protein